MIKNVFDQNASHQNTLIYFHNLRDQLAKPWLWLPIIFTKTSFGYIFQNYFSILELLGISFYLDTWSYYYAYIDNFPNIGILPPTHNQYVQKCPQ